MPVEIGSWLLDLTAAALRKIPELTSFEGHVSDSGEGRWTLQAPIDEGVPVSNRAGLRNMPTSCCPQCATNSAATSYPTSRETIE
jgi:hypothetical protein